MQDTSYTVVVSPRELDIPSEKLAEVDELVPVLDYMNERYGAAKESVSNEVTVPDTAVSIEAASDDDLPF
jgi:hypothetical protein